MDLRKIKKLIDLLEESNLAEIEIKEGEESVRLARTPIGAAVHPAPAAACRRARGPGRGHADAFAHRIGDRRHAEAGSGPAGRARGARADGRHLLLEPGPGQTGLRQRRPGGEAGRDAGASSRR